MSLVNILFVRHGKTDYNSNKIIQGQADRSSLSGIEDKPLNQYGIEEAKNVVPVIENYDVKPDVILSSPLLRARQTGEYISKQLNIDLLTDERLREMFFGAEWEGVPVDDFKKTNFEPPYSFKTDAGEEITIQNGDDLRTYHKDTSAKYDNLSHPGGETKKEVVARVKEAVAEFTSQHPEYKTICIPTHNALMRFLLSTINREEADIKVEHTEIVHLQYDTDTHEYSLLKRIKPKEDVSMDAASTSDNKFVLIGLPGTGKTTVAKAMADIINEGKPEDQHTKITATDPLFRIYRAMPANSEAEGSEIMKNFLSRVEKEYPKYYEETLSAAQKNPEDPDGKCFLYDSKLFREIGSEEHGEDIFRLFEIEMLKWLEKNGKFENAIPDLSASAALYDENREIFSPENGYTIVLLKADEDLTVERLYQDYLKHLEKGGTIRGAYEIAVRKDLEEKKPSPENKENVIREALRNKHLSDKSARIDRYESFAHLSIEVTKQSDPRQIATQILSYRPDKF